MICPCGVDHWLHAVYGLKGILGMFAGLEGSKIPPTKESIETLEKYLTQMRETLDRLKASS